MRTWPERLAVGAVLLLPLVLLHGRGIAEALILVVDLLFRLRCARDRDIGWLRRPWVMVTLLWWGWLVACSVLHGGAGQAVGVVRFPLFAAALEVWVLRDKNVRAWLLRLVQIAATYIAVQSLVQLATGRNLFGYPRGADGELTGPYAHPRAAPPFVRLLFPAVLPPVAALLARPGLRALWGAALLLAPIGLLVAMGQRMPLLLAFLGLFVTALLIARLRGAVLAACVAAGLLIGASSVLLPEAHHRLVSRFSQQMEGFASSHYGEIAARALAMVRAHPGTGLGFDGFRRECATPVYFQGWREGDGGGAEICVQHPHNPYVQAAVEGGLPGLALFSAMALAWLLALGQGLWRHATPLRVGLFTAALLQLWPVASTSAWTSMPLAGWFALLLGLGLAETRAHIAATFSGDTR